MNLWALGFSEDMSDQTKINQAITYIMQKDECRSGFESILENHIETLLTWQHNFDLGNFNMNLEISEII